jgi:CubicO group peptidase (beta-lactamase class C family)
MKQTRKSFVFLTLAVFIGTGPVEAAQSFPAVDRAMEICVSNRVVSGVVSLVTTRDKVVHLGANGWADLAAKVPMRTDSIFWIASMTKPITATAVMMMQEETKLSVDDPVSKYLPELADLKTPDGKPAKITLRHLLTHTSGMSEATPAQYKTAHRLADVIPFYAGKPLQFEPGTQWKYCQSGIISLGRIVEIVCGESYPKFLQKRLFDPLGMKDTTFYLSPQQLSRLAKNYKFADGELQESPIAFLNGSTPTDRDRYPAPNAGLFSTASDYARFCQMILNKGMLDGKQYLKPESVKQMTSIQTGDIKPGSNAWGLGWSVVRKNDGISAVLSLGTFGHGGAYGTQAWVDPLKQVVYVLMVQRSNLPNGDSHEVRRAFQTAAALGFGDGH